MLSCVMLCYVMIYYVMFSHVMIYCVMSCMHCGAILFYVMLCDTISHATVHPVMSFREISCCSFLTHVILN